MKVFEVLHEALDIQQLPSGKWVVVDTDTGRPAGQLGQFDSAGAAEEARDSLRARTASSPDTAPRDGSGGRREPRITNTPITDPSPDGRIEPRSTNPDMDVRADIKPGTPSTGGLSAAERRRISRTGSITRNGTVYTRADIARRDAAIRAAGGDPTKPPLQQQAASQSRNPTGKQGFLRAIVGKIWDHPLFRTLRAAMGSTVFAKILAALNFAQWEDALDGYMRAIKQEAEGIGPDGQARFINSIRSGNAPASIARAYTECVERLTQLFLEGIISLLLAGGWTVAILLGLGIGTGVVGAIVALIAGGAFVIGGTALIYEILDRLGAVDMLENLFAQIMTPAQMLYWAITIDNYQEYFGEIADQWGKLLTLDTVDNAGDLIRDSIVYEESKGIVSSEEQKNIIKDIIKSDPKLLSAYNNGKEEAKEIMRSQSS